MKTKKKQTTVSSKVLTSRGKAMELAGLVAEKHGSDLVLLNIGKLSSVADYILIASAESDRQVQAIAKYLEDWGKSSGERPLSIEGADTGKWALMDFNDVIVHVFLDRVRELYDLEGFWMDAPRVKITGLTKPKTVKTKKAVKAK